MKPELSRATLHLRLAYFLHTVLQLVPLEEDDKDRLEDLISLQIFLYQSLRRQLHEK